MLGTYIEGGGSAYRLHAKINFGRELLLPDLEEGPPLLYHLVNMLWKVV